MDGEPLTVVIPNYNGAHLLPRCLDALVASSHRADRVVVVDDASSDGSLQLLSREFTDVEVVALEHNRGFPGAVNAGIERALALAPTTAIFLLNNDAIVEPDTLEVLRRALREHPDCHAFACCMTKDDDTTTVDSAGLALARGFAQLSIGDGEPAGLHADDRAVLGACGGAALFRAKFFATVGTFDTRYFAYFEDYDLALRACSHGIVTRYLGQARVKHLGSATLGRHSWRGTYLYSRNSLFFLATAAPFGLVLRESPWIVFSRLRMLALAVTRGRGFACALGLMVGCGRFLSEILRHTFGERTTTAWNSARSKGLSAALREGERLRSENRARRAAGTR